MDTDLITLDKKELTSFVEEGGKFLFKPSAEEAILKLHSTIEMLQQFEDDIKDKIAEMGRAINPNFKGVKGEKVSCVYRKYGSKYDYDFKKKNAALPFLKEKVYYSVDSEKVDKYLEEVKELPEGIVEASRDEKLSFSFKEE